VHERCPTHEEVQAMRPTRSPASAHRYLPLVVGLVAAAAVACGNSGTPDPPKPLPPALVGEWCGGSNSDPGGHYTWTFYPNGSFDAFNSSQELSGTAVVHSKILTIYPTTGGQQSMRIAIGETIIGPMLYLDDYSYVRGRC